MIGRIVVWTVGALLTGLYVYTVAASVGNIVMLPRMATSMGLGITPWGWFWLAFGALLPAVVYALALLVARGRKAALRLLVLAAGLGLVAAAQLEVMHLVPQTSFFA
ncbi:hypothetical protein [Leucobacter sp. wl10]|uniref:hypothetical protein n=1 Tax=Leucobacter sp. wl10 TaxID=2304677 RepID=UPI000E5A7F21|nr:hypothetical protein [Leucobacter sp. wl10]RGE23679.1 hypothetical protein D1J51_01540 [Leucobacter sp. wl10]